jgi:hypothetical protein
MVYIICTRCAAFGRPIADLSVTITATSEPVLFDSELTYTITVSSSGTARVAPVLTVVLPTAAFVSAASAQGSCARGVDLICELGDLRPDSSVKVIVVVRPTQLGAVTLSARVSTLADVDDPDSSNNTTSYSTAVLEGRNTIDRADDTAAAQIHVVYVVPSDGVEPDAGELGGVVRALGRHADRCAGHATRHLRRRARCLVRPAGGDRRRGR